MRRLAFFAVLMALAAWLFFVAQRTPSNDRNWSLDQKVLPSAEIKGQLVHVKNIRNFNYRSTKDYDVAYYDKTFDLADLKKVYFVIEPFHDPGAAHTFLSFEFANDEFISISVEIRKEEGEAYSPLKGLFRNYELMYVIADERDVIKLRSNFRKDDVYVYPARTTPEKARELFLSMVSRANALKDRPEFYNTLTNTCTTNIVRHVNSITPGKIPFSWSILLPRSADRFAYELGLLDTDLPFNEARERFRVNDRAALYADDTAFSAKIRATGP